MIKLDKPFNSLEFAKKFNRQIISIPLNDGSTGKVFHNSEKVDCFVLKNGKVVEMGGAQGSPAFVAEQVGKYVERLQKFAK